MGKGGDRRVAEPCCRGVQARGRVGDNSTDALSVFVDVVVVLSF